MYKKTITYNDYFGGTRTEDFYFNISKAEALELELSKNGGLGAYLKRIINAQDQPSIIKAFKDIILLAYGEKSPDGKYFIKEDENGRRLADKFKQTEAYSDLFMELSTNTKSAIDFVNGIVPSEYASQIPDNVEDIKDYLKD